MSEHLGSDAVSQRPVPVRGRTMRRRVGVALVVGTLLSGVAACADESSSTTPDDTDTTVSATDVADLLGPDDLASGEPVRIGLLTEGVSATVDASDEVPAGQATVEWLNQHRGGIGGRPVELVTCEMHADPAGAADCANRMVQEDVVAVTLPQSAYAEAIWQPLHDAGIPLLFSAASGENLEHDAQSTFIMINPTAAFFALPVSLANTLDVDKVDFVVIDVPQAVDVVNKDGAATMGKADLDYDVVPIPLGTPDMVPQMQHVKDGGAGVVHILGNDSFCIAAIQSLKAVGYTGAISGVSQCFTDATRAALGAELEGISVLAPLADGATDDPGYQLYLAVMEEYGTGIKEVDGYYALGGYAAVATLAATLETIDGEITAATAAETIRSMPETELPAGGGVTIKCGGSAMPAKPAICTNQYLRAELDAEGNPTNYTVEDATELVG